MAAIDGTILTQRDERVLTLTIANPRHHNAMSLDMFHQLTAALQAAEADRELRAIVLRGQGSAAFTAGVELTDGGAYGPLSWSEIEAAAAQTFQALDRIAFPVISLVQGYCFGGGVALALGADLRLATDDAVFVIPAARLGVGYPPQQVARLVDIVGPAYATEILYTARRLTAADALACGLVTRIASPGDAECTVNSLARSIAENAPKSIYAAKAAIRAATNKADAQLAMTAERAVDSCTRSEDFREGIAAFLQRRPPAFTGG